MRRFLAALVRLRVLVFALLGLGLLSAAAIWSHRRDSTATKGPPVVAAPPQPASALARGQREADRTAALASGNLNGLVGDPGSAPSPALAKSKSEEARERFSKLFAQAEAGHMGSAGSLLGGGGLAATGGGAGSAGLRGLVGTTRGIAGIGNAGYGAGGGGMGGARGSASITVYGRGMGVASGVGVAASGFIVMEERHGETYRPFGDNPFRAPSEEPVSTFGVDVDTASYANVRRYLSGGSLPPPDAVRIEELVNYFRFDDPLPNDGRPFAVSSEVAAAPWQPEHKLVRIALRGREIPKAARKPSNIVFLVDVSGSMSAPDKLPLVQASLKALVRQLGDDDSVALVVYAGAAGVVLQPTRGREKARIDRAIEALSAGGSTNGAGGIRAAYDLAAQSFVRGGANRVILATDGDFNVGITSESDLLALIEQERKRGIFLTTLGFGTGNFQDARMELLADHGNGNYAYIDSLREAEKVLVRELSATLFTLAKDVKLQVEPNANKVVSYRLLGYENRVLAREDFDDDQKDAGDLGAGHAVTALYEVVPSPSSQPSDEPLLSVKLRYKLPDADESTLINHLVEDASATIEEASEDLRFAAAVALFGMGLRNSPHRGIKDPAALYDEALRLAVAGQGQDPFGDRAELLTLVTKARALAAPSHE